MSNKPYALITGASSGIGFQYARVMAERGYNLVIVSNEADALAEKEEELKRQYAVNVVSLFCDLGRQSAAQWLYDTCRERNLEIEILINNAGVYHDCDFLKDSLEYNQLILNLHVNTPALLVYYFGREMVRNHKGYILNMSSIASNIPVQRLAAYGATKSFLKNFSRSIHIELYDKGVKVTAVCPGAVATGLYHLSEKKIKIGLKAGIIMPSERLARKGIKAMFKGRARITPGLINHIGLLLIGLIPTCLLRWIRKHNLF